MRLGVSLYADLAARLRRSRSTLPLLTVGLVAITAYLPALWAGFVADDFTMLRTVGGVADPFSSFGRNDLGEGGGAGHFYRPLWVLWNAAIVWVFGERAVAFHALNLLLFAVVAMEVWLLARRFLPWPRALIAALFFALYPRHGESVAWVSGNTDLLATALAMGSLLTLLAPDVRRRLSLAAALTVAAALVKESAFVLPVLAFLVLRLGRHAGTSHARELRWRGPVVMVAALLPVLLVRALVLGGVGGYTEEPVTPRRVLASAASYLLATVTPPQLEVLRFPVLLTVPAALTALAAWALWQLRASRDAERLRSVALGLAWFAVSLLPVLGQPLDVNNSTGERLRFLPSVGLAVALGALLPTPRGARRKVVLATAATVAALSCLFSASSWVTAGDIAERIADEAAQLAPSGGQLIVLSLPESYRNAHVFTNSFDVAVSRAGRSDALVSWCIPVHVRHERGEQIHFRREATVYVGTTTWAVPFDYPVVGEPGALTPGCAYARRVGAEGTPGLELEGIARPAPSRARVRLAFFDGRSLRSVGEVAGPSPQ